MRLAVFLLTTSCAATSTTSPISPRALTVAETQCESGGLTIRDYTETEDGARWAASCYGRFFQCEHKQDATHCTLAEQPPKQAPISAEQLAARFNACLSGQGSTCHALAEDLELGRNGVPPDRFAAIEAYGYSCRYGNKRDCTRGELLKRSAQRK